MKLYRVITVLLAFGIVPSHSSGVDKITASLSTRDREIILASVGEIRSAILQKNAKLFLQFVSRANGLTCTDKKYTYNEVAASLADLNSHLYMSLFDSRRYLKQCGANYPKEYPAIAEAEFLQSASDDVELIQLGNDWTEVVIKSTVKSHHPRTWYFHREAQSWKISDRSFVIGSCTCG